MRNPGEPTLEEYGAHRTDHMPCSSWCLYCVNDRATRHQQRRVKEEQRIPQLAFDYLHGTKLFALASVQEAVKILVGKCQQFKCICVHVVPQGGLDPVLYAVERLKRDVMWLGHARLFLKSDNGRGAILGLLRNILKVLQKEVEIENIQEAHPAAYDSSSNGFTGNASKHAGNMILTIGRCLEERIKMRVPVTHCLSIRLVEHEAWVLTTGQ